MATSSGSCMLNHMAANFSSKSTVTVQYQVICRFDQVSYNTGFSLTSDFLDTIDITTITKKKWKSLCDTYRTYKNKQQKPSGSAGTSQKKWVHLERMKFLSDMQPEIETVTNIATCPNEQSNDTTFDECSSSGRGSRNYKRRYSSIDDSEDGSNFDRLVDAINQPISIPPFVLPTPLPSDKAALYDNHVAHQFREINPQVMDDIMLQLFNNVKKNNPY